MLAHRLKIVDKVKEHPVRVVEWGNFVAEANGEVAIPEILKDPTYSLYCLNRETQEAVFVRTPAEVDLCKLPFFYMAQYDHAVELATIPLPEFHRLAKVIPLNEPGLIFVHSTGRCGSTLVSKAFEAVPQVLSLSEPDVLTQIVAEMDWDGTDEEEISALIDSSIRWQGKPAGLSAYSHVVIKPRSQVSEISHLMIGCFPRAKNVFLYRDARSWLKSIFTLAMRDQDTDDIEVRRRWQDNLSHLNSLIRHYQSNEDPLTVGESRILNWMKAMESYLAMLEQGVHIRSLNFADLIAAPLPCIKVLFAYCEVRPKEWDPVELALGRDSQEGSIFDRAELSALAYAIPTREIESAVALIQRRGTLTGPGMILPNPLMQTI